MINKVLRILSVNVTDTSGGAARAAYRIHCALRNFGINSMMFVKNRYSEDLDVIELSSFENSNLFINILRYIKQKLNNKLQHIRWCKYQKCEDVFLSDLRSVSVHNAFKKIEYDLLHLHWINLRFLNLKELLKLNKPIIWNLHDSWPFCGICHYPDNCERYMFSCGKCPYLRSNNENDLSHIVWKEKRKIYPLLNLHIVTPSHWLAEKVIQSSLLSNFPVTVIPNPIDTDLFTPGDKQDSCEILNIPFNKKRILFGAINALKDKRKGFEYLHSSLTFIEQLLDPDQFELAIFGADIPLEEIKTQIHIRYLGFVNSDDILIEIYRTADVMVVPSISEAFGQTVTEAMACGIPVVAFNCSGIKEIIDHKQNGYLAQPYDSNDLANGIIWCLENNLDKTLSINARKKVEGNYSSELIAKKFYNLYKSILTDNLK